MKARYVVRITPADVGRRVSVRSRLPAPSGPDPEVGHSPTTTDTLGYLRVWREGILEIERRDGTVRRIAEDDLLAARVVPPPPARAPRT